MTSKRNDLWPGKSLWFHTWKGCRFKWDLQLTLKGKPLTWLVGPSGQCGGTAGPLRLAVLEFVGPSKLRLSCTINAVLLLILFWEAAWTLIHHIRKAWAYVGWENNLILLFIWFCTEWSKAPICFWKRSPRDVLLRAMICKQRLLFWKGSESEAHLLFWNMR